jgi:hypothetical protein
MESEQRNHPNPFSEEKGFYYPQVKHFDAEHEALDSVRDIADFDYVRFHPNGSQSLRQVDEVLHQIHPTESYITYF